MCIYSEKQERGNQLYRYLLLEKSDNLASIPYHVSLVEHKSADKEKERHPDLHEVSCEGVLLIGRMETVKSDMEHNDKEHGEATHRVNVLDASCAPLNLRHFLLYVLTIHYYRITLELKNWAKIVKNHNIRPIHPTAFQNNHPFAAIPPVSNNFQRLKMGTKEEDLEESCIFVG